jgi:hypothetical protein
MINEMRSRTVTAEVITLVGAIISVLIAAVLTQFPPLRFGSFWLMAGVLVGADLVVYVLMKARLFKIPRA